MLTEKQLINKWNTIGLLDGLPEHKWGKMSQMYEDTATILLNNNIVFKNNISNFFKTNYSKNEITDLLNKTIELMKKNI